jgi:polyphenol oxidase
MTLPPLPPSFRWSDEGWGNVLRCVALEALAQHAFTTRQLSLRGESEAQSAEWGAARALVNVAPDHLARVRQVHGRAVSVLPRSAVRAHVPVPRPDADALVTDHPDLALAVLVADCVPLLIADGARGVVAAVHAGWRGTSTRVACAAVEAMTRTFGCVPRDLTVAIGPSIGPCCYEVGEELVEAFEAAGHPREDVERWFSRVSDADRAKTSLRLDVARANRDQLVAAGVHSSRIFSCGLCTRTHGAVFHSYRADGRRAGRMAALIRSRM